MTRLFAAARRPPPVAGRPPPAAASRYRFSMSRITTKIRTIAMRLKQIDEMLQPIPG